MKNTLLAALGAAFLLACLPTAADATALSDLTAATASNTINNANKSQSWEWNSLTNTAGLNLSSNGTTTTNGAPLLELTFTGANSNSNVRTYGLSLTNSHSGTGSTDYGILATASNGTTNNYGVVGSIDGTNAGDVGVWGAVATGTTASYGIYGTNVSSNGYAGYFNNTGGGYAAAFLGGNVGIGTATPLSLVHVYGGEVQVGSSGASCAAANGGAIRFSGSTLYYCDGTSTWQNISGSGSGAVSSGSAGQVAYYQSTGTTVIGTSTMNIVGGSVGIGTPSPSGSAALQMRAAANQTLQVSGPASAASGTSIRSIKDDYSVWEPIEIVGSTTILGEAGNVGVATTSPSYTLQVNGSVAGTSAYVNTSDVRHKKNILPLEVGLKEVAQLRPVTFEWKDDALTNHSINGKVILRPLDPAMQGKQMGFVAQDVERILPSVVVIEANAEKTKGMKYSELIPVLVKAVQELKTDNDTLRSDFEAYRASHH